MNIAQVLNETKQLLFFNGWIEHKGKCRLNTVKDVLFRINSSFLTLDRLKMLNKKCVEQYEAYEQDLQRNSDIITFWSPTVFEYYMSFSNLYTCLICAQDRIPELLIRIEGYKGNPHSSLADAVKKLNNYTSVPKNILDLILEYWESGGKSLRDFRNLDQHFVSIVDRTYLIIANKRRLHVVLPDNPQVKSSKKLTFDKDIDALQYFWDEHFRLAKLLDKIGKEFYGKPKTFGQGMVIGHEGSLEPKDKPYTSSLFLLSTDQKQRAGYEMIVSPERSVSMIIHQDKNKDA